MFWFVGSVMFVGVVDDYGFFVLEYLDYCRTCVVVCYCDQRTFFDEVVICGFVFYVRSFLYCL